MSIRLKVIRKRYRKGLKKGLLEAIYSAYTKINREAYKVIISTAPRGKAGSSYPSGFLTSYIRLVIKKRPPYSYEEVDVPGKHAKGSSANRAWIAIQSLHGGWTKLPFKRIPKRGTKVLKISIMPGQTIYRPAAVQQKQITLNPWIERAWKSIEHLFPEILEAEIEKLNRSKIKKRVV